MSNKSRRTRTTVEQERLRKRFAKLAQGPIEPVIIGAPDDAEEVAPVHIFSIGETDYYMPGEVPASLALQVLEVTELDGQQAAVSYALRTVLGDDGFDALKNHPTLKRKELSAVMDIVMARVMGALDDEGN